MKDIYEDDFKTNMEFQEIINIKLGKNSPRNFTEYWKISILENLLNKANQRQKH